MATTNIFTGATAGMEEDIAPTWERRRPYIEEVGTPVREWILRELAPAEGDTVLELAAGTGDTGFEAASAVGPRGRLISTDLSPAMLATARRRGRELGLVNVEYRVMDAEAIDRDVAPVDGIVCRFGLMLMHDPARALAESRRVLRREGRLTLAVWAAPDRNPFFALAAAGLIRRGHLSPPQPGAPGIFAMADPGRTQAMIARAGFEEVRVEEVAVRFPLRDVDEYLDIVADTAGPLGALVRRLPPSERAGVAADVERAFTPFATGAGYVLPGVALCAVAS